MSNKVDFDDYTENYNQLLNEGTRFFSSSEEYFARYKIELVRQNVHSPVGRLLEYGCGIGRNIPFLQHAFPNSTIVGSDISGASLEIARRDITGVEFFLEDGNVDPTSPFDLIFVAGVFHHVPVARRVEVAETLFDRLSPGGQLFVFEHNPLNPITRRIVNNCPYDEDAVLLMQSELKRILRDAALIVEHMAYCLFIPPRLSALSRLENWLGWLPLGGQYWIQARRPA
ncbi:MAG: class I SAM-dependent methyltransferase [Lysobacterales bacterium]|nr:MAG: class I SAM-dependent methyltransferase [Xanthomonadales bacterium]